ncbi:MAG: hydrogenase maturation nickel metallochaperone HypA [Opitutus sp.]
MHELGIAESALRAVLDVARDAGAVQVRRIVVRIGARSGVEPEAFRFALDALRAGTDARDAAVELDCVAATGLCTTCGARFAVPDLDLPECPDCGSAAVRVEGGRELDLMRVDLI